MGSGWLVLCSDGLSHFLPENFSFVSLSLSPSFPLSFLASLPPRGILADRRGCEVWLAQFRLWCCHFPSTQRVQGHQALANEQTPAQGDVPSGEARGILSVPMPNATRSQLQGDDVQPSVICFLPFMMDSVGRSSPNDYVSKTKFLL